MDQILDFFSKWVGTISDFFASSPVTAGIITLLAIALFFQLRNKRLHHTLSNIIIVLVIWAIVMPMMSFILESVSRPALSEANKMKKDTTYTTQGLPRLSVDSTDTTSSFRTNR